MIRRGPGWVKQWLCGSGYQGFGQRVAFSQPSVGIIWWFKVKWHTVDHPGNYLMTSGYYPYNKDLIPLSCGDPMHHMVL